MNLSSFLFIVKKMNSIDILTQLSQELEAGLNQQQIMMALKLLTLGVDPSALLAITQILTREQQNQ